MTAVRYENAGTDTNGAIAPIVHTATSAEATAEVITLDVSGQLTGVPDVYLVQIYRSGVLVGPSDAAITTSAGTITITEKALTPTYEVTAGDVVMAIAVGSAE